MTEGPQILRIKIGDRWWLLNEVPEAAVQTKPALSGAAELLVVRGWTGQFEAAWDALIAEQEGWVRLGAEIDAQMTTVIGPARKVRRYVAAAGAATGKDEPPPALHRMPPLPDPCDVPRFREEGIFDPFGNDVDMQRTAWRALARHVGLLSRAVHDRGVAISAPENRLTPMVVDSEVQPWRTIFRIGRTDPTAILPIRDEPSEHSSLDLLQRCLIAAATSIGNEDVLEHASVIAEEFGSLLSSAALELESLPESLLGGVLMGELMADMHNFGVVHGDAHPGNFIIQIENRTAVVLDMDTMAYPERPLTDRERAGDLALLKASLLMFEMWEAVEAGYRAASLVDVDGVFRLI
jgi:hypothetical protein